MTVKNKEALKKKKKTHTTNNSLFYIHWTQIVCVKVSCASWSYKQKEELGILNFCVKLKHNMENAQVI